MSSVAQSSGTCSVAVSDPSVITASGGTIGPFRYVAFYNDTPTSPADPLICWCDYGSAITLADTGRSPSTWAPTCFYAGLMAIVTESVTIGDFTGTVTVFGSTGGTETIAATNLVRPSDWNSGHNQHTLSGNTTNASTASGTNVVYEARGDVTLGGSTGTLVFAAGIGQNNEQWIGTGVRPFAAQTSTRLGQNSLYFTPVILSAPCRRCAPPRWLLTRRLRSASGQKGATFQVRLYSQVNAAVGDTVTRSLRVAASYTMAASYSSNVSSAHSAISAIGNSVATSSYSSSSAGANVRACCTVRELIFPISSLFAPGEYWMAVAHSTSAAGTAGAVLNISNVFATVQTTNRSALRPTRRPIGHLPGVDGRHVLRDHWRAACDGQSDADQPSRHVHPWATWGKRRVDATTRLPTTSGRITPTCSSPRLA